MIKKKNKLFRLIVICLFTIYATTAIAQLSKVDSVIMYLKKSFATNKLDSVSNKQVFAILNEISLNGSQLDQIESTLNCYKNWQNEEDPHVIRRIILASLINSDVDKAISYGKQQIELLERTNNPVASSIKFQYLDALRIPFRNSNRLEDGFQYYTKKLNEYKIYNIKKSISYLVSAKNKVDWYNNTGTLGYFYYLKENADDCIKNNRIAFDFQFKEGNYYAWISTKIARAFLMKNQLDSAGYFIALAKTDPTSKQPDQMANTIQAEAEWKIQSGANQEKYRSISFEAEQQMNEKEFSIANLESQNRIASLSLGVGTEFIIQLTL